jgi:hypothetical protein
MGWCMLDGMGRSHPSPTHPTSFSHPLATQNLLELILTKLYPLEAMFISKAYFNMYTSAYISARGSVEGAQVTGLQASTAFPPRPRGQRQQQPGQLIFTFNLEELSIMGACKSQG